MLVKRHSTLLLIAAVLVSQQYFANHNWPQTTDVLASAPAPDITDRPDPVSAQLTARLEKHRVHIKDFDNASETTYANPNGTFTTEVSAGPIRTSGPKGWVPIDTHLVADRGRYRPAAADGGATISSGGSGDIATATSGAAQVGIGFGASLPTPTVNGATAVYTNAIPGVNVVATAVDSGFDIQLLLTSRPTGPLTFNFPIHVTGLKVTQDSSGVLRYLDRAGNEVFTTSAPLMSGAETDPHSGMPTRSGSLAAVLVTDAKGSTLQVTPDATFLADPSVTYPVTIDPTTNISRSNYGFDQSGGGNFYNNTIAEDGVTGILRVGIPDTTHPSRGFYSFSNSTFVGKVVSSATLTAWEHWSWSCSAREVDIYDLSTNYTTSSTWASPPTQLGKVASATVAKGFSTSCPAGNVTWTVTSLAQRWAGLSSGLHSLELRAASETDNFSWKEFSGSSSASKATLAVTYNSYPNTPTNLATTPATPCTAGSGRPYIGTTTPLLSATVADPDGGTLKGAFEIWNVGGSEIGGQNYSASVASGSTASWIVPTGNFVNGGSYSWRVRGYDGSLYSQSYSPSCEFTIATTVDPAPTITSTNYPSAVWSPSGTSSSNFSWADSSGGDANGWQYQQDKGGWSAIQPLATTSVTWNPSVAGLHELDVRAVNKAGVLGSVGVYTFGVGSALVTPADQDRTQASVALSAGSPTTYPWGAYMWHQGTSGSFSLVPTGDVTYPGQTNGPTWPVGSDANGNFSGLNWNLVNTARAAGLSDGVFQVEACFYSTQTQDLNSPSVCGPSHNVQLSSEAFGATYATAGAGPGSVSLQTGEFEVTATDGSVPTATASLSVGRSLTSADPTGELTNTLGPNFHNPEPPLTGWSAPNQAVIGTASSPTVLGANSLQLAPSSGTCSVNCYDTYVPLGGDSGALRLGLQPGRTYTFTAREYVPSTTGLITDVPARGERPVFIYQIGTQGYVEVDGTAPTATGAWQLVYVTFTVPDSATEAFVRLYNGFNVGKTADAVYYDDLTLVKDSVYGLGWNTALPGPPAGDSDLTIADNTAKGYVTFTAPDGAQAVYTVAGSSSCCPIYYVGQNDANDGTLVTKTAANTFTMTDPDGTVTTWQSSDGGVTWVVQSVVEPGTSVSTTYAFDADGRVAQVVGPSPVGIACTAPLTTAGCRTLTLTYTPSTATPPSGSSWGDYPGLLKSISFTAADPTNGNAMINVGIASFAYDSNGLLRQSWDPRLSSPLKATYGYGADLRLNSVTPPGLNAWSLSYDSSGRLSQVSRTNPSGGTDVTTFVYDVPFTGASAPIEMGASTTSSWGETSDVANYAAAVFDPNHSMPAGTTASSVGPADWPYAVLNYLDVNGREVNTASYGASAWQIATSSYDKSGNVVSQLTSLARDEALSPTTYQDTDPYVKSIADSPSRASLLSTINSYSADGIELVDTVGPMHPVTLTDGTIVDARTHSHTTYDEGAPSGGPYRLPTTVTTAAQTADAVDHDLLTSHTAYDPIVAGDVSGWTLRLATRQTTVIAGGTSDIVSITRYDAQGRAIETRMPANTGGGDAHASLTTYYGASGPAPCVKVADAGLLCQTAPAAQPTSGPHLLTTTTTYNMWGQPLTLSESNGTGTRTTTMVYDSALRECVHSVTTASVGDTALPAVYTGYDPITGLVIVTGNISGTTPTTCPTSQPTLTTFIQMGYDSDGRVISYTDANNNAASVTYTPDGLAATFSDGKGTVAYTYDGVSGEHRRLETSLSDSQAGSFSGTYDANGRLAAETYPSGLVATRHFDDAGQATALTYTMGSTTWLNFTASYGAHGQILAQTSPGSSQRFVYDKAGRLTQVADTDMTVTPTSCTTRVYAYDADSNRLSLTSYPADAQGGCTTATTPTVTSHTYDQGDRISNTGYTYDPLGRTTAIAASDAGGTVLANGYYTNDMVASQAQGASTKSFGLDPAERISTITTGTSIETNLYADGGDSPAWIRMSDGSWTRNVQDLGGNLSAIVGSSGSDELQLVNLHGDIVATAPNSSSAPGTDAYFEFTEFGIPRSSNPVSQRYGWLGGKRRDSGDALAGIVLMGVRLYSPSLGRFLQTDPVPGGSANNYDYVYQDPVNKMDLDGKCWGGCWFSSLGSWANNHRALIATAVVVASIAGGIACGVSIVCGVAVGVAAGAAYYAANHAGLRDFSWGGMAASAAVWGAFGATGIVGRLASKIGGAVARSGFISGRDIAFGRNFRISLGEWANPAAKWMKRLPHYHRRGAGPGQGIGRHRPWETKSTDTSFGDRF